MKEEPKGSSEAIVHVEFRFLSGRAPLAEDLHRMTNLIVNLLDHEFPNHSGLGMTVELEDL